MTVPAAAATRPVPHHQGLGTDLEWFWRGWFYTTGHVDIAITGVQQYALRGEPERTAAHDRFVRDELLADSLTVQRNAGQGVRTDRFPELLDFYNAYDELDPTPADTRAWTQLKRGLDDDERAAVEAFESSGFFYAIHLENQGGVVMPVPLLLGYADGTTEQLTLPAEIWRRNPQRVTKVVLSDKELSFVELDTYGQIADTDRSDNRWPQTIARRLVGVSPGGGGDNPMKRAEKEAAREAYRPTAEGVAAAIFAGWTQALEAHEGDGVLVPAAAREAIEAAMERVQDPWGRPLRLAFATDEKPFAALAREERKPAYVRIATFRSAGEMAPSRPATTSSGRSRRQRHERVRALTPGAGAPQGRGLGAIAATAQTAAFLSFSRASTEKHQARPPVAARTRASA